MFIKANPTAPKIKLKVERDRITGEIESKHINETLRRFLDTLERSESAEVYYFKKTAKIKFKDIPNLPPQFGKYLSSKVKGKTSGEIYLGPPSERALKIQLGRYGTCDICGDTQPLTDATMWMYPLAVDPGKFGNFYPGTKRGIRVCPRCALAGLAGYLGWLWRAQGRNALHIFLFHTDLQELERLHREVFRPLQVQAGKGGNINLAFWGFYLHETALGLLFELFSHIERSDLLTEQGRNLLAQLLGATTAAPPAPLRLYAVTGKPGQAFNMQEFQEFSRLHNLYQLYKTWKEKIGGHQPHQGLVHIFQQFQTRQGNQYETLWRDKIAWAILKFGDPLPFIEQFLFEARAREKNPDPLAYGTEEVFDHYTKEVLGMDEKFLETLRNWGHLLGAKAHKENEMGLLYALRNARNPDDLLRVFNDIQFRLELTVPEVLLQLGPGEKIKGTPWGRVKTLLSIYAMNAYLRASSPQTTQKEGNSHE
ncbi:MAG: hypothetical protein H5U03_00230 [Clostridia bacterium]|nr:hypothetical protein [Clostridia bacterium]